MSLPRGAPQVHRPRGSFFINPAFGQKCTGVVRPLALGLATNEILGLITHDPLVENAIARTKP
jgi:hypothetical protein